MKIKKTKEQLIEAYKKANKERRQKIAEANGFSNGEDYLASLMSKKPVKKQVVKGANKMKGTFYVVDILDATGSMTGGKYNNSKKGIIDGIKDMFPRKDVKYSLIEFVDAWTPLQHPVSLKAPKDVDVKKIKFYGSHGANTPLYKTVYDVIETTSVGKNDKVLINVYTDGGNNTAYEYQEKAAKLIKKVQKENFTITFVATPEDLERITHDINIEKSNTLATANTPQGFEYSMNVTRSARTAYFANTSAGQDTLIGFYKQEGEL